MEPQQQAPSVKLFRDSYPAIGWVFRFLRMFWNFPVSSLKTTVLQSPTGIGWQILHPALSFPPGVPCAE
jgi:hypothetical protein